MSMSEQNLNIEIPPQVYTAYNLRFNNVTYRAVRKALEKAACYGQLTDDKPNAAFIDALMNRLIDASLERCGAERYRGTEDDLMQQLHPLVSNVSGLVQRHLSNFGPAPSPSEPPTSQMLQVIRADLHSLQYDLQREPITQAKIAAAWLGAAALLTGAAGDMLHECEYPITANRHAAQAKLAAIFDMLQQGIDAALDEDYPLPDKLDEVLSNILQRLKTMPSV